MNILLTYLSNRKKEGTRFLGTLACLCGLMSTQMAMAQDFYVTPDGKAPVDYNGSPINGAWSSTDKAKLVTLKDALQQAQPGDEIWVQGFEEIRKNSVDYRQVYLAPKEGWTLKAGVKLYGGFKGNETSLEQRATLGKAYNFACRSILSGDISMNDTIDHVNLISSSNALRADNALHVLTMNLDNSASDNKNETVSVLDGFTIVGGHAPENGGGVLVKGHREFSCAYRIERCFFFNNYAVQNGGAIYVDADAGKLTANESYINQCVVYNNEAGLIAEVANKGGGIYIAGKGTVVNTSIFNNENGGVRISPDASVLNSTIARNTVAGVDLTDNSGKNENAKVVNTVVWGNTTLFSEFTPGFRNSSYHEVEGGSTDGYGNVYVSDKNNDRSQASPFFASPSLKTSFDRDFNWLYNAYPLWDWQALEGSAFIDGGDDDAYASATYGANDLGGSARKVGDKMDIGAYEFQSVPADRILRVAPDGNDGNDGSAWNKAYKNVQAAIDKLAAGGQGGEVWVKTGTYQPSVYMSGASTDRSAAFVMKDGVSVYGGFEGGEKTRAERDTKKGSMPWQYKHSTVFVGNAYGGAATGGGKCEYNTADNKWSVTGSNSNHVVWFAQPDGTAFKNVTVLDGVTIKGGSAQETEGMKDNFFGDRGAGVYMAGNANLINCVVTENAATGKGGGVYLYGGRIIGSLLYNNEGQQGGAVYVDNSGIVLRSMLTNNSGYDGAAVYMVSDTEWTDGSMHPEYQILSTSVVSNNTSRHNGAVYCNQGGVMLQTTMVNNVSVGTVDPADNESAQTGGLYVKGYGLSVNSVLWNNLIKERNVPMYAVNPTVKTVRFFNTAVSGMNNSVWNNTLQQDMVSLSDDNSSNTEGVITPDFEQSGMPSQGGVDPNLKNVEYYWFPKQGSNLRSIGLELGRFPEEVVLAPELDIKGDLFAQKPSVGAVMAQKIALIPETDNGVLRLYVDVSCTDAEHDGSSWAKAYRSINEAIEYFANVQETGGVERFEILVREGDCYPRYSFTNLDPKTATINVLKTSLPLVIKGGYRVEDGSAARKPLEYRSVIDGNPEGKALEDGLYHCITVAEGADVEIDGFHVVGGYAVSSTYKSGAGMLVGKRATVTVCNTVFENNTAVEAAAISAQEGSNLTLVNCVVNNNTNTTESASVIAANNLTMHYVTVVNNKGAAPTGNYSTSFSAGNTSGSDTQSLKTLSADGAKNFANPTNAPGATLGYDTYLGGYSEFRPLTSSTDAAVLINQANEVEGVTEDISGKGRNLGGKPDLGAYEADLPESGRVIYVRENGTGDGLSWEGAMGSINGAVNKALAYNNNLSEENRKDADKRAQVWVAAGTYAENPVDNAPACFIIKEGVDVLGGFPASGCPGVDDRRPLVSQEIYTGMRADSVKMYETILLPLSMLSVDEPVSEREGNYYYNPTEEVVYVPADANFVEYVYLEKGYYKYFRESDAESSFGSIGSKYIRVGDIDLGVQRYEKGRLGLFQADDNGEYIKFKSEGNYPVADGVEEQSAGYYLATEYPLSTATFVKVESREKVEVGDGYGNWLIQGGLSGMPVGTRLRVLSQEDNNNPRIFVHSGNDINETKYVKGKDFVIPTMWDGFTITKGRLDIGSSQFDGGAGARIFNNVTLKNCIVTDNWNTPVGRGDIEIRGGGVYCYGGTMVNCYIQKNRMGCVGTDGNFNENGVAYGGGIYTAYSTLYNCIIAENEANANYADGAGVCMEVGEFYNNTVLKNRAEGRSRACGGIRLWVGVKTSIPGTVKIYNTISYGNTGWNSANHGNGMQGNANFSESGVDVDFVNGLIETVYGTDLAGLNLDGNKTLENSGHTINISNSIDLKDIRGEQIFQDYANANYRLTGSYGLNRGLNEIRIDRVQMPKANETYGDHLEADDDGKNGYVDVADYRGWPCVWYKNTQVELETLPTGVDLFDYTDMDYTDRVKDCTVDAGAYERKNEDMVKPDDKGVYYVTFNGNGTADASSPANAACAMKLQEVLNAAGRRVTEGRTAIVKIAGYESYTTVYHSNTLANPNDPKSYTFVIPNGVTVMGGYNEGSYVDGIYQDDGNWNDDNRDATQYMTVLSAVSDEAGGRQAVNGYHAVQFGQDGMVALDKQTVLDGVYLEDGLATASSGSGSFNTRGGGAVVPKGAHIRNCVVRNNEAIEGGGLFVLPGGMVSGCGVMQNKADKGAGMYLSAEDGVTKDNRAHVISGTVVENEAAEVGGGFYLEDGAALTVNTVVWGNTAPSDKNISGVTDEKFEDALFGGIDVEEKEGFYPFNNCFVETYELPGNYGNHKMEADKDLYFEGYYIPRSFSLLVKGGTTSVLQQELQSRNEVAAYDMQGISRIQQQGAQDLEKIDAGAYAYLGGSMKIPDDKSEVIKRIFVSLTANVKLEGDEVEREDELKGRSFYTGLASLDEALDYINKVRAKDFGRDMDFEIWMAEGTYKPRNARKDADPETGEPNQRQNSFIIPQGVQIFGGFSGEENYSYGLDKLFNKGELKDLKESTDADILNLLDARESGDLNSNGITEPWEMAHPTILSGHVNLSAKEKNVYHVLYSKADAQVSGLGGVTLDGLTIMDGETYNVMKGRSEVGRGAGIYTVGVDYKLVRCRLLNNKAVRGGAVYALNANVTSVGSIFAGNGTVEDAEIGNDVDESEGRNIRGGALYLAGADKAYWLKAVNTLWANNGTDIGTEDNPSWGGAVAVSGIGEVDLMNNTFVRNKAGQYAAVYVESTSNNASKMTNTAVWGNECAGNPVHLATTGIKNSAFDVELGVQTDGFVLLDQENNAVNGPRFDDPSTVAGTEGNKVSAKWEPVAISVLVDAGDGQLAAAESDMTQATGAYKEWMTGDFASYNTLYMKSTASRYAGPTGPDGKPMVKKIDIGVFEYQYPVTLSNLDIVYVATTESGKRDGSSWDNATSDLRGALNAMANATGSQQNPARKDKEVRIKSGTYTMGNNLMTGDVSYQISMSGSDNTHVTSLTVNGSYNESGIQDFGQPTVLTGSNGNNGVTLLSVATNGKPVNISGLSFQNARVGLNATTSGNGKLTLKNSAFRKTSECGMSISDAANDEALIANTLFADGETGLNVVSGSQVKVVNATFANNNVAGISGSAEVYNSVAWKSGTAGFSGATAGNGNKVLNAENTDLENGPNFVDPNNDDILKRDYNIRPSFTLLNQGRNESYTSHVASDLGSEQDLAGKHRVVGERIDVGAYEYASELSQYIYVKQGVAGSDNSGSSWEHAMSDLQGAVDLATVYANTSSGNNGYVFVHQNVESNEQLHLTRGGVKVYGGMNAETVVNDNVKGVLMSRSGLLETADRSALKGGVTVSGASVVDGFEVSGTSSVEGNGMLATSILTAGASIQVGTNGILYNTLADGATVSGEGKAVNVTVVNGEVTTVIKQNVIEKGSENGYVTDGYWRYQLKETDETNIDKGSDVGLQELMEKVGHEKDIAGNKRVRGTVDKGCFETWNIVGGENGNVGTVSDDDYPHGKSVVYVREGNELQLERDYTASSPFNPGFLLLEHGAGLWGNGKQVSLRNFAAERKLTATNGYKDLVAMPFSPMEMTVDGKEVAETNSVKAYKYDGLERAKYDYKFASDNSTAWEEVSNGLSTPMAGLLFEAQGSPEQDVKLRFYGTSYEEDGQPKRVVLHKYNFNSPWSSPSDTGDKFTHKENMSWNLFGSPYLCTMNYEDMEYGRVVYGYANNGYYTDGMGLSADGERTQGNIPVGSAVFTQSATLKETETFTVGMREANIHYNTRSTKLALYVASAAGKRGLEENNGIYDELQLTAVPSEEASTEFDLARDGVKWMNDNGEPEIFAVRDGGRYSLLSAIDREGTIGVGVSLPEAGMYSIGIPEDCEAEDYEYVMLKDAATGKAADLKEGAYSFRTAEAGVAEGRFTLSFKRMDADQRHAIYVKSGMGKATVFGVNDGDVVTVVTVDGKAVAVEEAVGSEVTFALAKGAYLFKVAGTDGRTTVVKAMVR